MNNDEKNICVVGSGISGLACAYLLSHEGYQVTLIEKQDEVGMDAHCLYVENKQGEMMKINTPPRSFGKAYYPNLMELYRSSGVEVTPWSWAWVAFFFGQNVNSPYIKVQKDAKILGYALPSYIDLSKPLQSLRLFWDAYKFGKSIRHDLLVPELCKLTLKEYIERLNLSQEYIFQVLLPTLSMVCTCSYKACLNYPAGLVMEFYAKTSVYGQYRTKFGTQDAVSKLIKPVHRVITGAKVTIIKAGSDDLTEKPFIEYTIHHDRKNKIKESFAQIVVATQANHALKIVDGISPSIKSLLSTFKHETSKVTIHRDPIVMPSKENMWAPMNVGVLQSRDIDSAGATFTIWMNDSFPNIKGNLFQSWNPVIDIKPDLTIDKPFEFERPIMTLESLESVSKLKQYEGNKGIWFCGAWNACRIPLQESGVMSALSVVRGIIKNDNIKAGNFQLIEINPESNHLNHSHHKVLDNSLLYETNLLYISPSIKYICSLGLISCFAVGIAKALNTL